MYGGLGTFGGLGWYGGLGTLGAYGIFWFMLYQLFNFYNLKINFIIYKIFYNYIIVLYL